MEKDIKLYVETFLEFTESPSEEKEDDKSGFTETTASNNGPKTAADIIDTYSKDIMDILGKIRAEVDECNECNEEGEEKEEGECEEENGSCKVVSSGPIPQELLRVMANFANSL